MTTDKAIAFLKFPATLDCVSAAEQLNFEATTLSRTSITWQNYLPAGNMVVKINEIA